MRKLLKKHLENIIAGHSLAVACCLVFIVLTFTFTNTNILSLMAAATSSLRSAPATLYFTPYDSPESLVVGQVTSLDVNVNADVPINALGATIQLPQDFLEVVGISKKKSVLDLWTEETAIDEERGEVHFSGGTTLRGGHMGTGTVITLTVRAKKGGEAKIFFKEVEVFPDDGSGVALESAMHSLTYDVKEIAGVGHTRTRAVILPADGTSTKDTDEHQIPRSPDVDGNGAVNLVDLSILAIHMFGTYDARFDLDMDGSIGLSDISILFSKMGTSTPATLKP